MSQINCLRTSGIIMVISILLSLLAVALESDYMAFWGKENAAVGKAGSIASQYINTEPITKGLAFAMPVPEPAGEDKEDGDDLKSEIEKAGDYADDAKAKTVVEDDSEYSKTEQKDDFIAEELETNDETENTESETAGNYGSTSTESVSVSSSEIIQGFRSVKRSRAKTFLVVFMGHSGSTAYTTELRTHPEFEVELLEPLEHGDYQGNTDLALSRARELMDRGLAKGKIPGFKIRPFHIQNKPEEWRAFVKEYDTRLVWQYRENIVKQAIGEYRHRFLNDSSVVEGLRKSQKPCQGSDQKCRITIENMRGLHNLMNDVSKSDELLTTAVRMLRRSDETFIMRYEDYLYRRERTMRETFDFFGVDFKDTAPQRLKASPDSLCQMVINFQDVCNHFHPCQLWRPYLQDDVNDCRCNPGITGTFDATYCRREAWYQEGN